MSSNSQFNAAWAGIESSWQRGQLAHAYLLQGAVHGAAGRFADRLLNLIYEDHPQVAAHTHPDIAWIEPQSKSRQILIDQVRENLIHPLSQTSFSGGWKAGVLLYADRMNTQAANALLKTLEEPPARSLLLLISDEPQRLLPTISSRCQRIVLSAEDETAAAHWKPPLLELLRDLPPKNTLEVGCLTGRMLAALNQIKKEFETAESERIPDELSTKEAKALIDGRVGARLVETRAELLRTMLRWQRDVLLLVLEQERELLHFPSAHEDLTRQAQRYSRAKALQLVRAVEEAHQQLDRNLPPELVFESLFSQMG